MHRKATRYVLFAVSTGLLSAAILAVVERDKPHQVVLTWHASVSPEGVSIAGYNVHRSTTPGGPYVKIASKVPALTFTDKLVRRQTTYFYVVTAVDQLERESKYSEELKMDVP